MPNTAISFEEFVSTTGPRFQSTSEYAAHALREAILRGVLAQGDPLRQEELARNLSVSRMPVREALQILHAEGLVTFRTNHGFTVSEFRAEQIQEIAEIRFQLEGLALSKAIRHHTAETVRAANEALDALNEVENREGLEVRPQRHRAFHLALYQPCDMDRLMTLVESNLQLSENISRIGSSQFSFVVDRDIREHEQLLASVRDGNVERGVKVLEAHILGQAEDIAKKLNKIASSENTDISEE